MQNLYTKPLWVYAAAAADDDSCKEKKSISYY